MTRTRSKREVTCTRNVTEQRRKGAHRPAGLFILHIHGGAHDQRTGPSPAVFLPSVSINYGQFSNEKRASSSTHVWGSVDRASQAHMHRPFRSLVTGRRRRRWKALGGGVEVKSGSRRAVGRNRRNHCGLATVPCKSGWLLALFPLPTTRGRALSLP
jgi:hypothetical protein